MTEEFKLPGSSYQEVSKIIQGYAALGKPVSLGDVSKTIGGMDPTTISRNTGFLVAVGILEGGRNKAPTPLGTSLGNALMHEQDEEIKRLFAEIVAENEFLKGIVSAIRIRKGMDDNALRSHIAYSAGAKKGNSTTAGSGTLIEILQTSGAIKPEDGKFVVASGGALPSPTSAERTLPEATQAQRNQGQAQSDSIGSVVSSPLAMNLPSGTGGISITINIDVSCEASDLDTLGQKLRKAIDDLNSQIDEPASDEDADANDAVG